MTATTAAPGALEQAALWRLLSLGLAVPDAESLAELEALAHGLRERDVLADRLEALLASAEAAGTARCGTHRQAAALMTCFVPSPTRSDHVHFVDGAMGGYAAAARALKRAG